MAFEEMNKGETKEGYGRFQMRVINNYNKRTRSEMYGHAGGGCRVMQ